VLAVGGSADARFDSVQERANIRRGVSVPCQQVRDSEQKGEVEANCQHLDYADKIIHLSAEQSNETISDEVNGDREIKHAIEQGGASLGFGRSEPQGCRRPSKERDESSMNDTENRSAEQACDAVNFAGLGVHYSTGTGKMVHNNDQSQPWDADESIDDGVGFKIPGPRERGVDRLGGKHIWMMLGR